MSEFTELRADSLTLQSMLDAEITQSSDPQINGVKVFLLSPKAVREKEKSGISVWLYRVQREPDTLNRPPERIGPSQIRYRPLPLTLHTCCARCSTSRRTSRPSSARSCRSFTTTPSLSLIHI